MSLKIFEKLLVSNMLVIQPGNASQGSWEKLVASETVTYVKHGFMLKGCTMRAERVLGNGLVPILCFADLNTEDTREIKSNPGGYCRKGKKRGYIES